MLACQQTTDMSNLVQTLKSFSVKCYHRIEFKSSIVLLLQNCRMNIYVETFGTLFQDCATILCVLNTRALREFWNISRTMLISSTYFDEDVKYWSSSS